MKQVLECKYDTGQPVEGPRRTPVYSTYDKISAARTIENHEHKRCGGGNHYFGKPDPKPGPQKGDVGDVISDIEV